MALATAAAVFGLGMLVLPPLPDETSVEAPVEAPTPPAPPPPSPPPLPEAGAADAASSPKDALPTVPTAVVGVVPAPAPVAEAALPKATAAVAAPEGAKPEVTKTDTEAANTDAPPKTDPDAEPTAAHGKLADKDVAREAWRKNLPDISSEPGKASMLIPIRGSIAGAVFHVTTKPRSVLVTLPKAESMITMEFYGPKRDGFRQLWIKKDDGGTTMRIVLGDATDPQVEIKEEFVRVTVRRPAEEAVAPTGSAGTASVPSTPEPAATDTPSKPATTKPRD